MTEGRELNENKNDNKRQLFISFSPTNYSSESPSNSVVFQDSIKDCLGLRSEEKNSTVHTFLKLLKTYEDRKNDNSENNNNNKNNDNDKKSCNNNVNNYNKKSPLCLRRSLFNYSKNKNRRS